MTSLNEMVTIAAPWSKIQIYPSDSFEIMATKLSGINQKKSYSFVKVSRSFVFTLSYCCHNGGRVMFCLGWIYWSSCDTTSSLNWTFLLYFILTLFFYHNLLLFKWKIFHINLCFLFYLILFVLNIIEKWSIDIYVHLFLSIKKMIS